MSTDAIILADMPTVEGVCFRPVRGREDADGVYTLRACCVGADSVDLQSTCEGLPSLDEYRAAFAEIATSPQQIPRFLAEANDQVVGYTLIESWHEEDGRWEYLILG